MKFRWVAWLLVLALVQGVGAIAPHRMSLESVVESAEWIGEAELVTLQSRPGEHGSGVELTVRWRRRMHGSTPPQELLYWEGWPRRCPDGKVEAPLWSGSGLERRLKQGERFIALGRGGALLRAEPLERENQIVNLLGDKP